MGISGGKRKIKSKHLLDMKKKGKQQLGGQGLIHAPTNPTDITYIPNVEDEKVLEAVRHCERGHYDAAHMTSPLGFATRYPNTDSAYDMLMLRDCIGKKIFGTGYTGKLFTQRDTTFLTGLPFSATTSYCTTAQNTRDVCPPGKTAADPMSRLGTGRGVALGGGKRSSRKKNPRSSAKRSTVKKQKHY